jgi:REP element-mobilizing transposase RayT
MPRQQLRGHLPRLAPENYQGFAVVHWVMTIDRRATGWLDDLFHAHWREAMIHVLVYYDLVCPVYCLMPDHAHVIWMGCSADSNQQLGAALFRTSTNYFLAPSKWQKQGFDHVLGEEERRRGAFHATCHYVRENPVRKNLVTHWQEYSFTGALVPGLQNLNPRRDDFWDVFWKVYVGKVGDAQPRAEARGYHRRHL